MCADRPPTRHKDKTKTPVFDVLQGLVTRAPRKSLPTCAASAAALGMAQTMRFPAMSTQTMRVMDFLGLFKKFGSMVRRQCEHAFGSGADLAFWRLGGMAQTMRFPGKTPYKLFGGERVTPDIQFAPPLK